MLSVVETSILGSLVQRELATQLTEGLLLEFLMILLYKQHLIRQPCWHLLPLEKANIDRCKPHSVSTAHAVYIINRNATKSCNSCRKAIHEGVAFNSRKQICNSLRSHPRVILSEVETSKKRSIMRGIPKLARGEYHYEVISLVQGTNITALAISLRSSAKPCTLCHLERSRKV